MKELPSRLLTDLAQPCATLKDLVVVALDERCQEAAGGVRAGVGSREGGRLQSERGARSEYSKGYAGPSGVGLPHMTM